jgi:hypothetical protein
MNVQRTSRYMSSPVVGEPDVWTVRTEYQDDAHIVTVTTFQRSEAAHKDHVGVTVHPVPGQGDRSITVTGYAGQLAASVGGVAVWLTLGEATRLAAALVEAAT